MAIEGLSDNFSSVSPQYCANYLPTIYHTFYNHYSFTAIRLERLEGIRENTQHAKNFRYSLNSWSFYQLQKFVDKNI
jgi:hypothetical protein